MIYSVPFVFDVHGVKKGGRKHDQHKFGSWVDVDIPHVTSAEAPVSMRWSAGGKVTVEVRWFNGSNYQLENARHSAAISPERLHSLSGKGQPQHVPSTMDDDWQTFCRLTGIEYWDAQRFLVGDIPLFEPGALRTISSSEMDVVADQVREKASKFAFIDGCLWAGDREPVYQVCHWSTGRVAIFPYANDLHRTQSMGDDDYFRADRLDDAVELAARAAADGEAVLNGRIEVLMPEAVTFDDEADAVLAAGRNVVDDVFKLVGNADRGLVHAWVDLRDEVRKHRPDAEKAMELMSMVGGWLGHDTSPAKRILRAEQRWSVRPIDMGSAFCPST